MLHLVAITDPLETGSCGTMWLLPDAVEAKLERNWKKSEQISHRRNKDGKHRTDCNTSHG
jgi:hypothetical protein